MVVLCNLLFQLTLRRLSFSALAASSSTKCLLRLKWRKPRLGWTKINLDGSFMSDSSDGGWGAVLRDCTGNVFASGAGYLNHLLSAFQAEAKAANQGVKLAIEKGCRRIILETDSLNLQAALLSCDTDRSAIAVIVEETKALLSSHFSEFQILHCNRCSNTVAHGLASLGRNLPLGIDLFIDCPRAAVIPLATSDQASSATS